MLHKTIINLMIVSFVFTGSVMLEAKTKHALNTSYPSSSGLIMAGYQGWFRGPGDGTNQGFGHYGTGRYFDENHCTIDVWPDVREYAKTYETPFMLASGERAKVFSSADRSSVDLHFKWMQQYGVDGVFVQRFFDYARGGRRSSVPNTILDYACDAASKYNRAIAVMYDLSGLRAEGEDCLLLINDWKMLVDSLKITHRSNKNTYLYDHGRPVVAIWGVGFPDRPYDIRKIKLDRLIDFLQHDPVYGGCKVMLGVPTFWRTLESDCIHDDYLHQLIRQADAVYPWTVQRFTPLLHNDMNRYRDLILKDMDWCKKAGIEYVPVACPGFSWHNLSRVEFPDDVKPVGSIPRQGGKFYWNQLATAINSGANMIYVAMFDEVDEGTAIFKCTGDHPVSDIAKFIDMDGMPSDHYLWLTGQAARMLRKEIPFSPTIPKRR